MAQVKEGVYGKEIVVKENPVSHFLFNSTRSAWIWLILRLYLGYAWLTAGWDKVGAEGWTGENAGGAVAGFAQGAMEGVPEGNVPGWYAWFLESVVVPNAAPFAFMVAWGEVLVGLGLIVGFLTGIAAFFGGLMNVSFLLAGTVSTNPVMFIIATWLVLAWKVAGWYGVDRWALPYLGTPWKRVDKKESE